MILPSDSSTIKNPSMAYEGREVGDNMYVHVYM